MNGWWLARWCGLVGKKKKNFLDQRVDMSSRIRKMARL
ncbi:hypothetical protein CSB93_6511 [Pseudomonas paraeruginosa]|uniref:Uncharacterized protein n=1 Tax=Pseudomonas paraeruginosa TaxID=2994495 RepID=A0A2R3J1E8_9PSED|nr:hypothetical protein CSB93_6511 [Pseudomonas paraeruginosa]AWE91701.1 hypothetical protein CSC28_5314 [Pseudomonas paraeruginosa]